MTLAVRTRRVAPPGAARARRIVLHPGTEKTGTTSIQAYCAHNAEVLRAAGVLYPEGLGPKNHLALAAAVGRLDRIRHIGPTEGWRDTEDQARFRADVVRRLGAAARQIRDGTLLLSSEHLSSRLDDEDVAALRALLAPFAETIEVVIYLRRQDELLLSLYSTYVKSGGKNDIGWLAGIAWLDFDLYLQRWENVFGREHITVRRYPVEGDRLIADFFEAGRLPPIAGAPTRRMNRSLDARNLQILKAINDRMPAWDESGLMPQRAELVSLLEERSSGAPPALSAAERQAILERFAESNERVRRRYFPRSPSLFPEPAPRPAESDGAGFDDAIDLVVDIWRRRGGGPQPSSSRAHGDGPWRMLHRRARALRAHLHWI